MAKPPTPKSVNAIKHDAAKRKNIPNAEIQSVLDEAQKNPRQMRYPRNTDLDPQLVWRGKDEQDWCVVLSGAPSATLSRRRRMTR